MLTYDVSRYCKQLNRMHLKRQNPSTISRQSTADWRPSAIAENQKEHYSLYFVKDDIMNHWLEAHVTEDLYEADLHLGMRQG